MLLVPFLLLSVLSVVLAGGRMSALADLRFHHRWLVVVGLGLQVSIAVSEPGADSWIPAAAHVGSYVLGGVFLVVNRHVPFLWLVGMGGLLNFAPIVANGGIMPADPRALMTAGIAGGSGFANSAHLADPQLAFLGDVFAVPSAWPLANVFSIGDICIVLGSLALLHYVTGSRLVARPPGDLALLRRNRTFTRVWLAQAVSVLGDWIYTITAVTVVAREAGSGEALAVLVAMQLGPSAIISALGGPLVDRRSRRGLMIGADLARALAVVSLLFVSGPSTGHLWAVAACLGACGALFGPSLQASLPNLLPPAQLVAGNAVLSTTFTFGVTAGPLIGGFVVAALGPMPAFAFNAASFVLSALLLVSAGLPRGAAAESTSSPVRDLAVGMRYIARTPVTRSVLVVMGLVFLAAAIKTPLEPLFVLQTLASRPEALGLVGGAWGLGMIAGGVLSPVAARRWGREALVWVAIATVGAAVLAASQMTAIAWVLVIWVMGGAANAMGSIAQETLLQETTPDKVRGRVFAAADALTDGAFLVGAVGGGLLSAVIGVRGGLAVCGALLILAGLLSRTLLPGARRAKPVVEPEVVEGAAPEWRAELDGLRETVEAAIARLDRIEADVASLRHEREPARSSVDEVFELRLAEPAPAPAGRPRRTGFDDSGRPMAVLSLDGEFRELNAAFSRLVGYGEQEFATVVWPSAHDRADYAEQCSDLRRVASGEVEAIRIESTYLHREGWPVPVAGELRVVDRPGGPELLLLVGEPDPGRAPALRPAVPAAAAQT